MPRRCPALYAGKVDHQRDERSCERSPLRLPPPAVHAGYVHDFAAFLHIVFLIAVPITAVAFSRSPGCSPQCRCERRPASPTPPRSSPPRIGARRSRCGRRASRRRCWLPRFASVPRNPASYVQRAGRAGRRTGNALLVTFADRRATQGWRAARKRGGTAGQDHGRVASSSSSRMCRYGLPVARVIPSSQVRLAEA